MEISIAIEVFCLFVAHFSEVRSITGQLVALMIYKFKKGPAPWMNPHSDCLSFFPVVLGSTVSQGISLLLDVSHGKGLTFYNSFYCITRLLTLLFQSNVSC